MYDHYCLSQFKVKNLVTLPSDVDEQYGRHVPGHHGFPHPTHAGWLCLPRGRLGEGQEYDQYFDQELRRYVFR